MRSDRVSSMFSTSNFKLSYLRATTTLAKVRTVTFGILLPEKTTTIFKTIKF